MKILNSQSLAQALPVEIPSKAEKLTDVKRSSLNELAETGKNLPLLKISEETEKGVEKSVKQTVSELNDFVQTIQRGIEFSVHEETGKSIVSITDTETGEEIRRFPSEQMLSIAAHIAETLAVPEERGIGLIVNGKA